MSWFRLCWTAYMPRVIKKYKTTGFDINKSRIVNLRKNIDFNNEFKKKDFFKKKINFH